MDELKDCACNAEKCAGNGVRLTPHCEIIPKRCVGLASSSPHVSEYRAVSLYFGNIFRRDEVDMCRYVGGVTSTCGASIQARAIQTAMSR